MRTARFFLFFLIISLGVAGGLFLVWAIFPVEYANNPPASLRVDYKTDYVLMVAEVYKSDSNLQAASKRLEVLGDISTSLVAQDAIQNARGLNYGTRDLQLIVKLSEDLVKSLPTPTGMQP